MTTTPSGTGGAPVPSMSVPARITRGCAGASAMVRLPSWCLASPPAGVPGSSQGPDPVARQELPVEREPEPGPVRQLDPPVRDPEVLVEVRPDGGGLVR